MKADRDKSLYLITAIIGIALMFFQIHLYRKTFIPFKVPLFVTIAFSIIGYFIIQQNYKKTYDKKNSFFPFLQSMVSFGFTSCFCFLALNFYLADNSFNTVKYEITSKHTIGTKQRQPAIQIDYNGTGKEIIFYTGQKQEVENSKTVILNVRRGFFGYYIFNKIQLIK